MPATLDVSQDELSCARVALELAARLAHEEFDDEHLGLFCEPGFFEEAPFGGGDEAVRAGLRLMSAWCMSAAREGIGQAGDDVRRDWLQLIAGIGEPKAPSWAGYYANTNSQVLSAETLPVRRMYRAHGFAVARPESCPDDDLGVMLEFLASLTPYVCVSEAAAHDCRTLLAEHILPWISAWRWSMAKYARTDFYRGVGEFVFGLVRAYAACFGFAYVDDGAHSRFVDEPKAM